MRLCFSLQKFSRDTFENTHWRETRPVTLILFVQTVGSIFSGSVLTWPYISQMLPKIWRFLKITETQPRSQTLWYIHRRSGNFAMAINTSHVVFQGFISNQSFMTRFTNQSPLKALIHGLPFRVLNMLFSCVCLGPFSRQCIVTDFAFRVLKHRKICECCPVSLLIVG